LKKFLARDPYSRVARLHRKRDWWPTPFWTQPGHCSELEAATQVFPMWPLGALDWPPGAE
jgi:hypothetical protein